MVYGLGTRSYNRSTEARQNKKAQKEATSRYLAGDINLGVVTAGPVCTCRSFRLPHELTMHAVALRDDRDWRTWEEIFVWDAEYRSYRLRVRYSRERVK